MTDFREANPALTQGLDRASSMLSLICLVAMVLGAIGVAMSMRAHLEQRMDILATMKSIGARSSDILRIYLLQTLLLGLAGGLVGVVAGFGVEWTIPLLAAKLLPIEPDAAAAGTRGPCRTGHGHAHDAALLPAATARYPSREAEPGAAPPGGDSAGDDADGALATAPYAVD